MVNGFTLLRSSDKDAREIKIRLLFGGTKKFTHMSQREELNYFIAFQSMCWTGGASAGLSSPFEFVPAGLCDWHPHVHLRL